MIKKDKADIEYLKAILELVDLHKLDSLEIAGIKVIKTKHVIEDLTPKKEEEPAIYDDDLYYSVI